MKKIFLILSLLALTASKCEYQAQDVECCEEVMKKYSDYAEGVSGDSNLWTAQADNESFEDADDGFPWQSDFPNDFLGFAQAALKTVGTSPSDAVDTADASQIFEALLKNMRAANYFNDSGTTNAMLLSPFGDFYPFDSTIPRGTMIRVLIGNTNTSSAVTLAGADTPVLTAGVSDKVLDNGGTPTVNVGTLKEGAVVEFTFTWTPDNNTFYWLMTPSISLSQLSNGITDITEGDYNLYIKADQLKLSHSTAVKTLFMNAFGLVATGGPGANYNLSTTIKDGLVQFGGTTPGSAVSMRKNTFTMTVPAADVQYANSGFVDHIQITPATAFELTGIPTNSTIIQITGRVPVSGAKFVIPLSASVQTNSGASAKIMELTGFSPTGMYGLTDFDMNLDVEYDPALVD